MRKMQRQIKFRAWGRTLGSDTPVMTKPFDFSEYVMYHEGVQSQLLPTVGEDVVYMQYTGLKDKNGVEIYESDIVRYFTNYYGNRQEHKKIVEWIDDMQDDSFGEPLSMGYRFYGSEIEVIGNIYEHGHLLEANQ